MTCTQQQGTSNSVLVQWDITRVCSLQFLSCSKTVLPLVQRVVHPAACVWWYTETDILWSALREQM